MEKKGIENRNIQRLILVLNLVLLTPMPSSSISRQSQEWRLPVFLCILTVAALVQVLVRRSTAAWPWSLISFAQGMSVISRRMMLLPYLPSTVNGADRYDAAYPYRTAISMIFPLLSIRFCGMPEIRRSLLFMKQGRSGKSVAVLSSIQFTGNNASERNHGSPAKQLGAMMKRFIVVALFLSAGVMAALAGGQAEPLKVAILAPLSGPVPAFGESTRDGALLAIKEWNARGGVLGRQIKAIVEDSQCTPDPALNATKKVIDQDKVHYIIGEVCSKASIPISNYANENKVVQISPTSVHPSVTVEDTTQKTKDYIFRACITDELQGKTGARFAIQKGAKTVFLMLDPANDYVRGLSEFFGSEFRKAGGTIVGKEIYTADDKDFSAILARIKQAKPDIVYLPDYYNIVNLATKQAKEKGISAPFMGGDGWDSADLDAAASEGGYYTNHFSPTDQRAEVKSFLAAYSAAYQGAVPDALATLAYDAVNMLLQAIKDTGLDDPVKVKDTLAKSTFNAVSGKITFDSAHNPLKTVTIVAVKGGKVQFETMVNP